jgi:hypothetical protein
MLLTKIKIATVALVVGIMGLWGGMATYRTLAAEGQKPKEDTDLIQGKWKVVSAEFDGQQVNPVVRQQAT